MDKLDYYLSLIDMSYSDTVDLLVKKYGTVKDNYFKEKSYERLLLGEIKYPTRGNYKRTNEGLITHHIAENQYLNCANREFILEQKIPYAVQKKEALVYADLVEHLILHAQISYETDFEYGLPGYDVFILPMVTDFYVLNKDPKPDWMKRLRERSFLSKTDISIVLDRINATLLKEEIRREETYSRIMKRWDEIDYDDRKPPRLGNEAFSDAVHKLVEYLMSMNHDLSDEEFDSVFLKYMSKCLLTP